MIDRALELAAVFHCSPEYFLRLDADQLATVYDRAIVTMNRIRAAGD